MDRALTLTFVQHLAKAPQATDHLVERWLSSYRGPERVPCIHFVVEGIRTANLGCSCTNSHLQVSSIAAEFSYLKMLGHVYVVEDAKDLAQIVRDVTRYGGAYKPEVPQSFIYAATC